MERSDHPRVVVIGAGIVGSAIAMHLAERDLRPVLVAPDPAEQTTSARSFASISAFGTDPVGYYELACTALARWSKWAQRLGEVGFRRGGQLRWTADPQQGRRLALQVERARSRGYPIAPVDQAELRRLLPAAGPECGWTTPAFGSRSATWCCGRRSPCSPPGPSRSPSPAPSAWTSRPLPALACWSRPSRCPPSPTRWSTCPALLGQAARFLPVLRGARIARTLLAWRSMPTDRLPILGPLPGLDGLYLAVTHSGVTLAPVLGPLVAEEIATGEQGRLLAPFRPGRFAERATRVAHDVDELFR